MKLAFLSVTPFLALCLTSCVPYPVYKTVQPTAQMTVLDEQNQPIEGAEVILTTHYNPHGRATKQVKLTDQLGAATFESHSEWQAENIFVMHGVRFYDWYWCVKKPGFKTDRTGRKPGDKFSPTATVQLSRGVASECHEIM